MNNQEKKGSAWALLPLGVFLILFIGSGIISGDFYKMPTLVAFIISTLVAFLFNRKVDFNTKMEVFCKGGGNKDIILMVLIFLFAGSFSGVAKAIGGDIAVVNLGLSILPANLLITGLFVIGCFISISMGTSVGTIAAIGPIGIAIASKTSIPVELVLGAVVGGAMFGDNLSMISDTTIAATKTQGCEMKDKFKINFKVILPAAILVIVIYTFLGSGANTSVGQYDYNFIKIIPYLGILIAALMGANVIAILSGGIVLAGAIGFFTGSLDLKTFFTSISTGIGGMSELILISIIIGGIVEIIKENGGIDYVLNLVTKRINGKKGAEFGIGLLVSLVDACTANNTIAIVTVGPLAKDISDEYNLDSKRIAGILDMFSCAVQGIIPYGAQLMSAAALTGLSSFEIMKFLFYPYLMGISAIAFIAFFQKKESAEKSGELNAVAVE